jgi:hypothetical protein
VSENPDVTKIEAALQRAAHKAVHGTREERSGRFLKQDGPQPILENIEKDQIARALTYAGFVLVGYELVARMIVGPIKAFYADMTFGPGLPFKSYEEDVRSRHPNEFEACLLYLRDFMEAIDSNDLATIQELRKHRNELAHDLVDRLSLDIQQYEPLFERVGRTLFKLSNYRAYMEIGADPAYAGIDWSLAKGHEYLLFEEVVANVKLLNLERSRHAVG